MAKIEFRLPVVDLLKVLAAQCILLHHFSAYGPISELVGNAFPNLTLGLYEYGRMAVQLFLVIGGFLAAKQITFLFTSLHHELPVYLKLIAKRYLRLATPYVCALIIAVLSAAIGRTVLDDEFMPSTPSLGQFIAHVFLLNSLLEIDALSAGVWYVAIDLQLFALLIFLTYLSRKSVQRLQIACALLCVLGMVFFNRMPHLDNWAVYFFASYGLGALAWWARRDQTAPIDQTARLIGALTLLLGLAALWLEFRWRLALALITALTLWAWGSARWHENSFLTKQLTKHLHSFGNLTYALFLVHFPVLMLINALCASGIFNASELVACGLIFLGWVLSFFFAKLLYNATEARGLLTNLWNLWFVRIIRARVLPTS